MGIGGAANWAECAYLDRCELFLLLLEEGMLGFIWTKMFEATSAEEESHPNEGP